ncbi:MAG: class I SAM-dependent methyltransferase [Actinomycetota bacterium]|nr:class I SAM-dependent methyltransferase [Actinomycetota bacterium]
MTASTPEGTRNLTNQHYNEDPEIFRLFLDPSLKYSSGIYKSEKDTLEQAQIRKMHFVAEQLALVGGDRVLDIGCGWGALVLFLAEHYSCKVVGVTPSERQAAFILERAKARGLADLVSVTCGNFQDTSFSTQTFDAVTLLGSIVHMPDRKAVLASAYELLREGKRLYVSETCFRTTQIWRQFDTAPGTSFLRSEIFGAGEMVPLSFLIEAAEEAKFSLLGLTDLTPHYARTIGAWKENVRRSQAEIDEISPGLARNLLVYFRVGNVGWGRTTKHYALVCGRP